MKKFIFLTTVFFVACSICGYAASSEQISADDTPVGWASYTGTKDLAGKDIVPPDSKKGTCGGFGGEVYTVKNRSEFLSAIRKDGKKIIYVDGVIDMTSLGRGAGRGTMLPSTYDGSTEKLDEFIESRTKDSVLPCKTYKEWKTKYTASFKYGEDEFGEVAILRNKLNRDWKTLIEIPVKSDTTIIGLNDKAEIRGGSVIIKNVRNVVIRNLILTECYNPFPKIEDSDGLNAEFDLVSIQSSKYVWIDHCTFDTKFSHSELEKDKYETKDRRDVYWRVYDGQCDITNTNDFITISWCIFKNHDKTMLIGNSDSKVADVNHQTITLHHNWFNNCKQRLPFVRFATIHIFNNLYTNQTGTGIDRRKDCKIYSEANSFEEEKRSITRNRYGTLFDKGSLNIDKDAVDSKPSWEPENYYSYKAEKASVVKNLVSKNAGAGKISVKQ